MLLVISSPVNPFTREVLNVNCCPTCHRPLPKPKPIPTITTVDTANLSDGELYKHYQIIGPLGDVEFTLRLKLRPELRLQYEELRELMIEPTARGKRPEKRLIDQYHLLNHRWRKDAMQAWKRDAADDSEAA